ncbi:MAG: L-rhamnose mutarotase [Thermoguttaceae bacterium]|jgi:L-rhamnose mutarotase
MRIAERWKLRDPATKEEYLRRHDEIWPEMKALLKEAGYRNYSIWLSGDDLFAVYEMDDPKKGREILDQSEVKKKWEDSMRHLIDLGPNDIPEQLEQMFFFSGTDD